MGEVNSPKDLATMAAAGHTLGTLHATSTAWYRAVEGAGSADEMRWPELARSLDRANVERGFRRGSG